MKVYIFTVTAVRKRFMEPPLRETFEDYIAADDYDQANTHEHEMLKRGGWDIEKISSECRNISFQDIRKK